MGYLDSVGNEVAKDLLDDSGIGTDKLRNLCAEINQEFDSAGARQTSHHPGGVEDEIVQVEVLATVGHFCSRDLGDIQKGVEDGQEREGRGVQHRDG